jgi:multicomponent K+:H+ antiporter subunit F
VSALIQTAADLALAMLALAMLLCLFRLLRGPSMADRILALDTLYINSLAGLMTAGVRLADPSFFDAAIVIGMLGFVGTVALAKFLLRGDVIE